MLHQHVKQMLNILLEHPSVLPAPSWAPLSGMGVAGIVGPAWLASLAPFVQSSGHIHWCWRQGLTPDGLCRWGWARPPGPAFQDRPRASTFVDVASRPVVVLFRLLRGCGFPACSSPLQAPPPLPLALQGAGRQAWPTLLGPHLGCMGSGGGQACATYSTSR